MNRVGSVEVSGMRHTLPGGRVLFSDVSFRVGDGVRAALVGENGAGKTTLLRLIAGDLTPEAGAVARSGGAGGGGPVIRPGGDRTPRAALLLPASPPPPPPGRGAPPGPP